MEEGEGTDWKNREGKDGEEWEIGRGNGWAMGGRVRKLRHWRKGGRQGWRQWVYYRPRPFCECTVTASEGR